jgi:ribonuclease MRP protein subunit RMP1
LPGSLSSGQTVRKRFERESQLRTEKEAWAEWIREVLLPKAYLGFSGLVGDTQFANLGVVLMGVLADIVSVTGAPKPCEGSDDGLGSTKIAGTRQGQEVVVNGEARMLEATSLRVTGLQSGEIIERQYDSDDMGEIVERNTSDEDAKRRQIVASNEKEEAANTPSDGGDSRTASSTTLVSKKLKQQRPDTPKIQSALASAQVATGRVIVSDETMAQKRSESVTQVAEKANKSKQGKSKSKRKNAIDDLFAGLT